MLPQAQEDVHGDSLKRSELICRITAREPSSSVSSVIFLTAEGLCTLNISPNVADLSGTILSEFLIVS